MSSPLIENVSDDTFDEKVINSSTPVLVDFWAEWCGPCKMLAPTLDELAQEYENKVQIYKLNVDDNKQVPTRYSIRGIPCLILFKNGEVAGMQVGAQSKSQLSAFLDTNL
ncbi:MAG: thioredoxin TrxA [Gammaproteobacteria bacterium]|nr:thioredoxin TrxA [Pseudomonadota bacterium]MCH9663589.1 thioredoxin TrxA [Gammaproteobacteria bacterium]